MRNSINRSRHLQGWRESAGNSQRPTNQASPGRGPVRILLADDNEVYRSGLRAVLLSHGGWVVCGEVTNGREALQQAEKLRPDVVILDTRMPEMNGLDAAKMIMKNLPGSQVLLIVSDESENQLREVFAAGVRACILKSDPARELIEAVEAASLHMPVYSQGAIRVLLGALGPEPSQRKKAFAKAALSIREREVLQLVAEGKTGKEIAATLHMSLRTEETHRANIAKKIGAHSVVDLARYAFRNQMTRP